MEATRSYRIQLTDLETEEDVILAVVDLTDEERAVIVKQLVKLAGVPDDDSFVDEIAPEPEPRSN